MSDTYIQEGKVLDHTPASALSVNDVVAFAEAGMIGVCETDIAASATGALNISGVHLLAAVATMAFVVGDRLYWDDTNNVLTKVAVGNVPAGLCVEAKASATATAKVLLNAGGEALREVFSATAGTGGVTAGALCKVASGKLVLATATSTDDAVAVAVADADADAAGLFIPLTTGKIFNLVASGAITVLADVYQAAAGDVQALPAGAGTYRKVGIALAAAADAANVPVMVYDEQATTTV